MEISSVEPVEGLPDSYTAVVPITDQAEGLSPRSGEVSTVSIFACDEEVSPVDVPGDVTIRLDVNEPIHEWLDADTGLADPVQSYGDSLSLYRSVGRSLSSSMVRGPDIWHINEVTPIDEETTEVTVGRLGLPEFQMRMPQVSVRELNSGDRVVGPELLHNSWIVGWGRVRVYFEPDDDQPPPIPIWVPLQRLHCPQHRGCKAEYQVQTGVDEEVEVNLTVLGTGGGGGVKVSGNFGTDMSTENECLETVVPATLQLQFGKTLVGGTEVAYGMRATVRDLDIQAKKTRPIPPESDSCERPRDAVSQLPQTDSFDQTEAPEGTEYWNSITLRREVLGKITVGLELGNQIPLKFGMDYLRTSSREITVKTLLASGARYLGYAPNRDAGFEKEQQLEICWTTR